jgi:hypothetical protein
MTYLGHVYDVTAGVRADRTKENYRWAFDYFLKYLKIDDPLPLLQKDPRILESTIIEYIIWLEEERKLSHSADIGICIISY